jgi:hypothetical protein
MLLASRCSVCTSSSGSAFPRFALFTGRRSPLASASGASRSSLHSCLCSRAQCRAVFVAVALLHVCVACGDVVPLSPALVARSEPGRCVGQCASRIRYVARGSWRFPFQANPPRGPSCGRPPRFCARAAARPAHPFRRALRTPVPGEPPAGSLTATNGGTNLVIDSLCDTQVRMNLALCTAAAALFGGAPTEGS